MTVNHKSTERPQPAGTGDDARRELRRFFLLGPAGDGAQDAPAVVPVHLAAFLGAGRVRTDYPLYLGSATPAAPLAAGGGGAHGALCLGFDELISRARRALEGDGAAVGQVLRDNLKRLEGHLLDLLEAGELSEGHGRALLGAAGNDVRRRLARDAARSGWSVRETENRVKLASQPKKRGRSGSALSAEEAAALGEAADKLEAALGHEVKVRPRGGEVAVEIRLADLDEALALAAIIGRGSGD